MQLSQGCNVLRYITKPPELHASPLLADSRTMFCMLALSACCRAFTTGTSAQVPAVTCSGALQLWCCLRNLGYRVCDLGASLQGLVCPGLRSAPSPAALKLGKDAHCLLMTSANAQVMLCMRRRHPPDLMSGVEKAAAIQYWREPALYYFACKSPASGSPPPA